MLEQLENDQINVDGRKIREIFNGNKYDYKGAAITPIHLSGTLEIEETGFLSARFSGSEDGLKTKNIRVVMTMEFLDDDTAIGNFQLLAGNAKGRCVWVSEKRWEKEQFALSATEKNF